MMRRSHRERRRACTDHVATETPPDPWMPLPNPPAPPRRQSAVVRGLAERGVVGVVLVGVGAGEAFEGTVECQVPTAALDYDRQSALCRDAAACMGSWSAALPLGRGAGAARRALRQSARLWSDGRVSFKAPPVGARRRAPRCCTRMRCRCSTRGVSTSSKRDSRSPVLACSGCEAHASALRPP